MSKLDQSPNQANDPLDRLARKRFVVGSGETKRIRVGAVQRRHLLRKLLAADAAAAGSGVDLVVHVRDVGDEHDLVALSFEETLEQREDDVRPSVADVDAVVNGGTAGVD